MKRRCPGNRAPRREQQACSDQAGYSTRAMASPQGNGVELGLQSSLQLVLVSSHRRQTLAYALGEAAQASTWEPAPETAGKAGTQGFLRKTRVPTSFHS